MKEAQPTWIVIPILAHPAYTVAAISDCLAQSVPTRLLLINQGVDDAFRTQLEQIAEEYADRVFLWSHQPSLPSLSATWNRALDFVWESGGEEALVVNNDVRLHTDTVRVLRHVLLSAPALFVSAVGVTAEQFWQEPHAATIDTLISPTVINNVGIVPPAARGGPDFSCFLISKDCHEHFRFDESFIPAFCEDLDYHRRLLLAGMGTQIFGVNLPYLHYASATLKTVDEPTRTAINRSIESGSRAYYLKKWGGPVNQETFVLPFRQTEDRDVTTPALQRMVQEGHSEQLPRVDVAWLMQQGNYEPKGAADADR